MNTIDAEAKARRALELYLNGYNCAQAVFAAYHEECGLSERDALRLASGFGGGIGGMRGICGAVSGAVMAFGMLRGYDGAGDMDIKKQLYKTEQDFVEAFKNRFTETHCGKLLELNKVYAGSVPSERTPEYYKKRPCGRYVEWCAGELARALNACE